MHAFKQRSCSGGHACPFPLLNLLYRHLHSVALLVEVPSTHKLVSTPDDLRLTQGPTLNRSLLAFKDVSKHADHAATLADQ